MGLNFKPSSGDISDRGVDRADIVREACCDAGPDRDSRKTGRR